MALTRVSIPSPNHYAGRGAPVRLIVLHTTEGARTYKDLGGYFANPAVQASSHCGADDTPNTVGQYVNDTDAAWTVASYNRQSVNLELCAFASWTTDEWMQHPHMLANAAAWIAEEAARFNIPIVKLTDAEAQGTGRGVCQHSNLGVGGGGHHDCGPGFPIDHVLALANTKPVDAHYSWFDATKRILLGNTSELALAREYDRLRAVTAPTKSQHARLVTVQRLLDVAARRVWLVAHLTLRPAWGVSHRGWRYQQLSHRARGQRVV